LFYIAQQKYGKDAVFVMVMVRGVGGPVMAEPSEKLGEFEYRAILMSRSKYTTKNERPWTT
jgi:hypothetical protein